jgi:hypothetical protein
MIGRFLMLPLIPQAGLLAQHGRHRQRDRTSKEHRPAGRSRYGTS